MEPRSRPRRRDDVLAQSAGDSTVLLAVASGEYFTLDEVGSRVWELADGTRSVHEIAGAVAEDYDAPRATIEADVLELLGELAASGLVEDDRAAA